MQTKIKLRKIKESDFKYFLKWWKDKGLIALTSGVFNYIPDEKLQKGFKYMVESKKDHHYAILVSEKKIIGHLALSHINKNKAEIQIVVGEKEYWGKGLGTLAIKKGVDEAFNRLGYKEIYLEVRPNNQRAIKAYQNVGFKRLGIKEYPSNPNLPKVLMMSVLKDKP